MKTTTTTTSLLSAILFLAISHNNNNVAQGRRLGEPAQPQQPSLQEDTGTTDLDFLRALDSLKSQGSEFHHRKTIVSSDGDKNNDDGFYYVGKANERNLKDLSSTDDNDQDHVDDSNRRAAIRVTSDGDVFMSSSNELSIIYAATTSNNENDDDQSNNQGSVLSPSKGTIGDDEGVLLPSKGAIRDDDDDDEKNNANRDLAIIGRDDRFIVSNTRSWPYRLVGLLVSKPNAEGLSSICTGTVISSNSILTNAHCVYDLKTGAFKELDGFAPAVTRWGPQKNVSIPYGLWEYESVTMYPDYYSNSTDQQNSFGDYDIAVVKLKSMEDGRGIGDLIGHAGMRQTNFDSPLLQSATIVGYPGDKNLEMWASGRRGCDFEPISYYCVTHECDTRQGMSGSSLMDKEGFVYGVHWGSVTYKETLNSVNSGNILRDDRYNDIVEWSQAA